MDISELFDFYRRINLEDGEIRLEDRYVRGSVSLVQAKQDIRHNRVPISRFDIYAIVAYGIVSTLHSGESSGWKFEEAKTILASIQGISKAELRDSLQRKLSNTRVNQKI